MPVKLYHNLRSPPCRATRLTAKALDLELELVPINLVKQDHLTVDFLKINPLHTVPTIEDEGNVIWDSHAINPYLVDKYGKDDSLYPKDLVQRAVVNQRLHFDSNVLSARLSAVLGPIIKQGARVIPKDKTDLFLQGVTLLETLMEKSLYVAGNTLTVADFSMITTLQTAMVVIPLASNRFPKIFEWMARMEKLPYFKEVNQNGLAEFEALMRSFQISRQNK